MDGAVIPLRYCITRTPDVVRIDAATLAKASATPHGSAAVRLGIKVLEAPEGNMPENF